MKRLFDPDAIRAQIANLVADRERIDSAIQALEGALRSVQGLDGHQRELKFERGPTDVTLQDAVRRVCLNLIDGITRQRVIGWIEREYPAVKPNSSSVSASLSNLSKGENPMLKLALRGQGRTATVYSTEGDTRVRLNAEEIAELMDETATKGTGGWQSLWAALQKQFDKAAGCIALTPELRARLFHYYHSYGQGGWQNRARRVFRRELPHLFAA